MTLLEHSSLTARIGLFAIAVLLAYVLWVRFSSPLNRYPGPFLARWTNLWRLYHVSRGSFHLVLERLHAEYGPFVRVGPNVLDVDTPEIVKTVFNTKGDWKKTEYYHASSVVVDKQIVYNLFSQTDPRKHAAEKRPIAKYYSMNGVQPLEPHMDTVIKVLCHQLESRFMTYAGAGNSCDLGQWILFYTWDVVGKVTFSQTIGYLEQGRDFDGTLGIAEQALDYFSWVGCIPVLDHFVAKNAYIKGLGPPGFDNIGAMSVRHLVARYQGLDKDFHDPSQPDFLDKFIDAKNANPDTVDDGQIVSWLMINLIAGADTTAISIRSAIYFSLKNPRVWQRLRDELAAAAVTRESCPVSYKTCKAIPYLDAVVREALRMLPGVSLSLERYVPEGGYRFQSGEFVPGGAIVAVNPYLVCRHRSVWGAGADEFRPERWLRDDGETEEEFAARLRRMNDADLSFGAGSRICIGKSMGLMQVYKVVATIATLYDVELVDPTREWRVINSWFPRQEGLQVRISRRS